MVEIETVEIELIMTSTDNPRTLSAAFSMENDDPFPDYQLRCAMSENDSSKS